MSRKWRPYKTLPNLPQVLGRPQRQTPRLTDEHIASVITRGSFGVPQNTAASVEPLNTTVDFAVVTSDTDTYDTDQGVDDAGTATDEGSGNNFDIHHDIMVIGIIKGDGKIEYVKLTKQNNDKFTETKLPMYPYLLTGETLPNTHLIKQSAFPTTAVHNNMIFFNEADIIESNGYVSINGVVYVAKRFAVQKRFAGKIVNLEASYAAGKFSYTDINGDTSTTISS